MIQLIIILSGLMVIAGVIILTGHLNRRKRERKRLATLADATTEQVEQFVRDNLGKWAEGNFGYSGFICGYSKYDNDIIFGLTGPEGWRGYSNNDVILNFHPSYRYSSVNGNLSLIKITEKP